MFEDSGAAPGNGYYALPESLDDASEAVRLRIAMFSGYGQRPALGTVDKIIAKSATMQAQPS